MVYVRCELLIFVNLSLSRFKLGQPLAHFYSYPRLDTQRHKDTMLSLRQSFLSLSITVFEKKFTG